MLCRLCMLVAAILLGLPRLGRAADSAFPFGTELMLDVELLYVLGAGDLQMLEIEDDGTATIDLQCASVHATATVGESSITIVADQPPALERMHAGTPDRRSADLLSALSQVSKLAPRRRSHRVGRLDHGCHGFAR